MPDEDRVELERVAQELHDEATSGNPEPGRLRQFATQLKDKLLEGATTMAATQGIQMAELPAPPRAPVISHDIPGSRLYGFRRVNDGPVGEAPLILGLTCPTGEPEVAVISAVVCRRR